MVALDTRLALMRLHLRLRAVSQEEGKKPDDAIGQVVADNVVNGVEL